MNKDEIKELNDATYLALINLKIAKADRKIAFSLRGRFLHGQKYPTPYTEKELHIKKLKSDSEYNVCKLIFTALWKSRQRSRPSH